VPDIGFSGGLDHVSPARAAAYGGARGCAVDSSAPAVALVAIGIAICAHSHLPPVVVHREAVGVEPSGERLTVSANRSTLRPATNKLMGGRHGCLDLRQHRHDQGRVAR
jgi:hypothetical protein